MHIDNLIIELTRQCNMSCPHCLRGKSRNKHMDFITVNNIVRMLDDTTIGSLVFTGGEVTLALNVLNAFIEEMRIAPFHFGNFYIKTNGKTNEKKAKEFCNLLFDLNELSENQIDIDRKDDYPMNQLVLSNDIWHEKVDCPKVYHCLSFFSMPICMDRIEGIIWEGKARNNFPKQSCRPPRENKLYTESECTWSIDAKGKLTTVPDLDSLCIDEMYISSNGNIVWNCDLSYLRIDREAEYNINCTNSLQYVVAATMAKQKQMEVES